MKLAPIATRIGGDIGYIIEQRSTNGASPTLRQRVILNLRGKAITYISKPWLAQVKGNANYSTSKNKIDDHSSSNNSITGNLGLYLVPYSRFPFSAIVSKSQYFSGPGIGTLSTDSTRFDMTQVYKPSDGFENYQANYNYTRTESKIPEVFTSNGLNFQAISSRFKYHSLTAGGNIRSDKQRYASKSRLISQATLRHKYRPSSEFSWDNDSNLRSTRTDSPQEQDRSRIREVISTIRYQPRAKAYSGIASTRIHAFDNDFFQSSSSLRIANANLSGVYRWSQYVNLSASGNANYAKTNSQQSTNLSATQTATTNYPLASFSLDSYHYSSRFNASVSNSANSSSTTTTTTTTSAGSSGSTVSIRSGSQQSVSLSPSHTLSRNTKLIGGKLDLRFAQSVSIRESTRSQAIAKLNHSATANWRRKSSSLRLTGRDSRSLNSNQDSFQYINFNASISETLSRYSSIGGFLTIQATRQISTGLSSSTSFTSSAANLHYGNSRAFGIPRMTFTSNLRAYSRAPIPVFAASPNEQGPVDWENILSYTVGKLIADFKVTLSKESDGSSQSLIWLSMKRFF